MGTTNLITGYTNNYDQPPGHIDGKPFNRIRYFDCSAVNLSSAEVYQIFKVAAGTLITNVQVIVATAEGGAATLDVGDGDSTARYETDADLNSTGVTKSLDAQKLYTAEDTIDMIPSAALDAAKFYVIIEGITGINTDQAGAVA